MLPLLALLLIIGSCAQYDSETGESIVGGNLRGTLIDTLMTMDKCATMVIGDLNKSASTILVLGSQAGITSDIVLQFGNFSPLADSSILADTSRHFDSTVTVESVQWLDVTLSLYAVGFIDISHLEEYTPWDGEIYRLDERIDPIYLSYDDELQSTFLKTDSIGTLTDTSRIEIELPLDSLVTDTRDTLAFRIKPSAEASFLKRFFSRLGGGAEEIPLLKVTANYSFNDGSEFDTTVSLVASFSTFLVDDTLSVTPEIPLEPGRIFTSQGYLRRMLFWADLNSLVDSTKTLNKAELWLYADTAAQEQFTSTGGLEAYRLTESWFAEPDSAQLSGSLLGYASADSEGFVRMDITTLARFWQAVPDSNFGMVVKSLGETHTIGRQVFYGNASSGADQVPDSLKPKLRLVFTDYPDMD